MTTQNDTPTSAQPPVAASAPDGPRLVHDPLSWRAEWRRQWGRRRTLVAFGLVLALPLILVAAFAFGDRPTGRGRSTTARLVDLAQGGSANFALFIIAVSADLLLVVLAALFAGDSVPAEASWSSLRYLLLAPVRRARLLTSKYVVGLFTTALACVVLVGWSLLVGGVFYGWSSFTNPAGDDLAWGPFLVALARITGYLFVLLLPTAAIALWIGTRSDAPLAAVGGAVLTSIIFSILQQVDALDPWRNALPGHYNRAWLDLLSANPDWSAVLHGALWALVWFVAFTLLAYRRFRRADILS